MCSSDLRYSRNNGVTYPITQSIGANYDATQQSFVWTVPTNRNSDSAVIRITNLADANQMATSGRFAIKVCEGVNSVRESAEMNGLRIARVFPSPVRDVLGVEIENNRVTSCMAEISIVSADGRQVMTLPMDVTLGSHTHTVPVNDIASGTYMVILRAQGSELSLPFVIVR